MLFIPLCILDASAMEKVVDDNYKSADQIKKCWKVTQKGLKPLKLELPIPHRFYVKNIILLSKFGD